ALPVIAVRKVTTERELVVGTQVKVNSGVVLIAAGKIRESEPHELEVRDSIKAAPDRIAQADVLAGRACWRADVDPAGNHAAPTGIVAKDRAIGWEHRDDSGRYSRRLEYLCGHASRPLCDHELTELRSLYEGVSKIARVVPQTFIGKEEEQLVLYYGSSDAAGKLAKQVLNPYRWGAFGWIA